MTDKKDTLEEVIENVKPTCPDCDEAGASCSVNQARYGCCPEKQSSFGQYRECEVCKQFECDSQRVKVFGKDSEVGR